MKLNKAKYLSIFFLLCFATSFGLGTAQGLNVKVSKVIVAKKNSVTFSSHEDQINANNNFVFEKNENETESSFQVEAIILPFLISFFSIGEVLSYQVYDEPLSAKQTNPIYISVCNFRI